MKVDVVLGRTRSMLIAQLIHEQLMMILVDPRAAADDIA